jgi:hypothetical protein
MLLTATLSFVVRKRVLRTLSHDDSVTATKAIVASVNKRIFFIFDRFLKNVNKLDNKKCDSARSNFFLLGLRFPGIGVFYSYRGGAMICTHTSPYRKIVHYQLVKSDSLWRELTLRLLADTN